MQDLKFALLQFSPNWEKVQENQEILERWFATAPDCDIIVLPEMFASGFSMNPQNCYMNESSPCYKWLLNKSIELGKVICGSIIWQEGNRYFNRFIWIENGVELHHYNKRHLFSLAGEEKVYTAGNTPILIEYKGWKIASFICYDIRFPVYMRRHKDFNYDLLLIVASWPERRHYAWQQLLCARAIENQAYLVAVNRVGKDGNGVLHEGGSGLWDYFGKKKIATQSFKEEWKQVIINKEKLEKFRQQFRFIEDGDDFSINY